MGSFTPNPKNIAANIATWTPFANPTLSAAMASMLNVWSPASKYIAMMATRSARLATCVYMKNFIAA